MRKSILMILGAAMILASCSQDDTMEPFDTGNGNEALIQLRSTHKALSTGSPSTRAPYLGTISASNPLEALVLSSTATKNYKEGVLHTRGKMTFSNTTNPSSYDATTLLGGSDKEKFPGGDADNLYLFGLYPYSTDKWTVAADGATAEFTFTGTEDVMATREVTTTATGVKAGTYATLAFEHLLTKLEVSLKAKKSAAIDVWGNVTKIELIYAGGAGAQPNNKVVVPFDENTAPAFSAPQAAFPFYAMSVDNGVPAYSETLFDGQAISTTETIVAYSIVAPFTAAGDRTDLTFNVYTANMPAGTIVTVPLKGTDGTTPFTGETAGKAFGITFNFNVEMGLIEGIATVTDWIFSGKTEVPMGKP